MQVILSESEWEEYRELREDYEGVLEEVRHNERHRHSKYQEVLEGKCLNLRGLVVELVNEVPGVDLNTLSKERLVIMDFSDLDKSKYGL